MTQENDVKRPIQELEHDPIQKIEMQPQDAPEKNEKANQALHAVTTLMQKIQRQPMVAHLIRATERFNDRLGNQFGAAITYFSFCR
ncbi:Inner membrane protein YhjD [Salmonella enterica subsp. diarizonae]|uniref:Inner membrane protein YhjD n=1 Tax=Salmonella diarizonae TaxID=59204 RepID=A0A379TSC7_SALDZ|nr:Inner membrane protein YhjD [Salmonella enterica subsp. diarizonae]